MRTGGGGGEGNAGGAAAADVPPWVAIQQRVCRDGARHRAAAACVSAAAGSLCWPARCPGPISSGVVNIAHSACIHHGAGKPAGITLRDFKELGALRCGCQHLVSFCASLCAGASKATRIAGALRCGRRLATCPVRHGMRHDVYVSQTGFRDCRTIPFWWRL